ncbi:Lrp/AsnC family transcriptional regulator [Thermococcus henrietii]|uniref:Lrp/AsnC family transcriptional regulator n=1 Tax=Thermococcus henrietii TaxID=2016361 RepID=UPI000C06C7C9|nr:Lrp/AsnC family transcriptional regulator [Thermococcus henrietii]
MVDELDLKIISLLQKNARLSFREIARELDVAVGTVYNRIKKLEEEGVIRGYTPVLDYEKLGFGLTALIGIKAQGRRIAEIERKIAEKTRAMMVYDITGEFDIFVIAKFKDRADMNRFVKWLLSLDGVEKTNTSVAMQVVKEEPRLALED